MLRIAGEEELVVIAFVGEDLSETLVRQNPVVHAVRHRSDWVLADERSLSSYHDKSYHYQNISPAKRNSQQSKNR